MHSLYVSTMANLLCTVSCVHCELAQLSMKFLPSLLTTSVACLLDSITHDTLNCK